MTPLLAGLVDDAGLFPPSSLPMVEALARHRRSQHPMLSGRFLCPADRVDELLTALGEDEKLVVHLVGEASVPVTDPRLDIRAREGRVPTEAACYVEGVAPSELAGTGAFGKVRCGGVRIPAVEELAAYVTECVRLSLPFKGTAGMHAAIRGWESTDGQPHHGYLNLLLAVSRALTGDDVEAVLVSTDAEALAAEAISLRHPEQVRALFHSYGSCDTERPIRDAATLGMI